MLRYLPVILILFSVSAEAEDLTAEACLLIILHAFEPLDVELEEAVDLFGKAITLADAGLSIYCIAEANQIHQSSFEMAYMRTLSTASLIKSGIPIPKAIKILQSYPTKIHPGPYIPPTSHTDQDAFMGTTQICQTTRRSRGIFITIFEGNTCSKPSTI